MYTFIFFLFCISIPVSLHAEIIELKCSGEKYVYDSNLKPTITGDIIQTLVINTKSKKMDIIIGVKSKTATYSENKNIIKVKFMPDVFTLDEKILYEVTMLNRYTGEIVSSYKFLNKDSWNNSFVGTCEPTKKKF